MLVRQLRSPVLPILLALGLIAAALWYVRTSRRLEPASDARRYTHVGCTSAAAQFAHHASGAWLTVSGGVQRVLPDSSGRLRHQRFILGCGTGFTVLIVNDVSIGTRAPVAPGEAVVVRGQYEWDPQGGLLHFTHHAQGGGTGGWILLGSQVYQ